MKNVLVQQHTVFETLARVDTLCLDKTGTITTGMVLLSFDASTPITEAGGALQAAKRLAGANKDDANDTATAIFCLRVQAGTKANALRVVAFSSARKYLAASLRTDCYWCRPVCAWSRGSRRYCVVRCAGPLNACWLPVALMDLTRMISSRAPQLL